MYECQDEGLKIMQQKTKQPESFPICVCAFILHETNNTIQKMLQYAFLNLKMRFNCGQGGFTHACNLRHIDI